MIRFSIVTPVKNGGKYLEGCLRSVRQQRSVDAEHIVIDGNSTDDTCEILTRHEETLAHWESRADNSMYEALNRGMAVAQGSIIACLNSDDFYHDGGVLADVAAAFDEGVAGVYGDIVKLDVESGRARRVRLTQVSHVDLLLSRHCTFVPQPCLFIGRELAQYLGGFSPEYRYASDYDYVLRATATASLRHIPRPITVFRRHSESITYSGKLHSERGRILTQHGYNTYSPVLRSLTYLQAWARYWIRNYLRPMTVNCEV